MILWKNEYFLTSNSNLLHFGQENVKQGLNKLRFVYILGASTPELCWKVLIKKTYHPPLPPDQVVRDLKVEVEGQQ